MYIVHYLLWMVCNIGRFGFDYHVFVTQQISWHKLSSVQVSSMTQNARHSPPPEWNQCNNTKCTKVSTTT